MTTQTREPQRGLTFEDVWAMFQETDRKFQETDRQIQETGKQIQETGKQMLETDKKMQETDKKIQVLGEKIEKVSANVGGLNRSLGELIETLMAARLWEKFPGYSFKRIFQRIKILDEHNVSITEIDILLSNTEWTMAVEVKREPDKDDVKHHLKRMKLMRKYELAEIKGKKLLGAIAGGVVSTEVRAYAQESGLFVLELNGEQVSLLESPEGFMPLQG